MQQLRDLVQSRELLWYLTLRELKQRYRGSFLGWTWSMLNPLSMVLIYTFVFGVAFGVTAPVGKPSGVDIYGLYVLSGVVPWGFFTLVAGLGLTCVTSNAALVRKVAFPRETLVISQVMFSFVQFSIEMSIVCIALAVVGSPLFLHLPMTILLMLTLTVFATGISLMLAVGSVYFRDLGYLWTIISQVWFFATPVIYDPERFAGRVSPLVAGVLHWHPPAVFLRAIRDNIYHGRFPRWSDIVYCFVVAGLSLLIGLRIFRRFSGRIAEEL
jgi:ABC-type polysaccharide/polyol phosphate export permease